VVRNWFIRIVGGRQRAEALKQGAACLEHAEALQAQGQAADALALALEGLQAVREFVGQGRGAAEATLMVGLTTVAEETSHALGRPGPSREDLLTTLGILTRLSDAMERFPDLAAREPARSRERRLKWVPYLRDRVGERAGDPA
jgi:hypothetical protein